METSPASDGAAMRFPIPELRTDGIVPEGNARNWPLDCWWVAAHASELSTRPILRWLLEMPVALYRTHGGMPAALLDRCPHRWAPLSMGEVAGDDIVCRYHGLRFASSGQCVRVPSQVHAPPAIRVRAFPVAERHGFLWVWTGDAARADPGLIAPELDYLIDPAWQTVWGYMPIAGNYMQIQENVLDLTHFPYLHKSLGVSGWDRAPTIETTATTVTFRQMFEEAPLPPAYAIPAGKAAGKPVTQHSWGRFLGPAAHHGAVELHDAIPGPEGLERFEIRVAHFTTPVTAASSHYYWAVARDHGEPFDLTVARARFGAVFREDAEIIEATQALARRSGDQEMAVEFSVAADRAGIEARRRVQAMVEAERTAAAARPAGRRAFEGDGCGDDQ